MNFHIVDVFGNSKYSGNQLAVFHDTGGLSSDEMQLIAREMNFSETTFVVSSVPSDGGYRVRIFTPLNEIDFAGHPTLGTAYIISKYIQQPEEHNVVLNLTAGKIPVCSSGGIWWMKQNQPIFGSTCIPEMIAEMLGLSLGDIDKTYPVTMVSTGLPFTIIPLKSLNALKKAKINSLHYKAFIGNAWAKGLLAFSRETYEENQHLSVRVFVDYLGIPEDPATGSATGCLAAYLLKYESHSGLLKLITGQGYEIGRPSSLFIEAGISDHNYDIRVGGRVIEIAGGQWY